MLGQQGTGKAVRYLLIANLAVFILQNIPGVGGFVETYGALIPRNTFLQGQIWRIFTYMFLHSTVSIFHIVFNMLILWMFGVEMENIWGTSKFLRFYFICGAGSALFSLFSLLQPLAAVTPVIGASGAVIGVLTAYAFYYPHRQVLLFFIIPINIKVLIIGYAIYSFLFSFGVGRGTISHITHLGGILVAYIYLKYSRLVTRWATDIKETWSEKAQRAQVQEQIKNKRYFEQEVDPVLEKISKQGMDSLTKDEKRVLKKAAKMDKERLKRRRILPFNLFS
ncbi:Rhomboid family protein [Chitinispirillum alkaliphilum]|nr:Rhomboid family protein [Chitinispirillum alkaliphilum]